MEMTDDRIQTSKQTKMEIINGTLKRAKNDNSQNGTQSSAKNQSNNGIDEYQKNEVENERYELAETRNVIKYIGNTVKRTKHIIDQNSAKPKDYDKWTDNEQYEHIVNNIKTYFPDIPDSLGFMVKAALHRGDCGRNSTDKPEWLDMKKFQRGQKFARDHNFSISIANILSLFVIFSYPGSTKPLIFSQQSRTPYRAFKRYLSTGVRVRNWMTEDPWTVGTRAYDDIQTVRRMHRAVRLKLCERDDEEIDTATKIRNPWCPSLEIILKDFTSYSYPIVENNDTHLLIKPKGINQGDMAVTLFAFTGIIVLYANELGMHASDEDLAAFCHTWRSIGYLLGTEDQYNFCRGSLKEIKQRARDLVNYGIKYYMWQLTPEWEHMLRCITESTTYYGNIFTFKVLLLYLSTELLNIDMPHLRSTLTYLERFKLMLLQFICRYAIRLRFVRDFMNSVASIKTDEATKYRPEKHEELKKKSKKVLDEGR